MDKLTISIELKINNAHKIADIASKAAKGDAECEKYIQRLVAQYVEFVTVEEPIRATGPNGGSTYSITCKV